MKKVISPELHKEIKDIYITNKNKGVLVRDILPKINDKLKKAGHPGYTSEKSLYTLVGQFDPITNPNKILDVTKAVGKELDKEVANKLKNQLEFDADYSWQKEKTKEIALMYYDELMAMRESKNRVQKDFIELGRITREFIDLGVKIEALNAKKLDTNNNSPMIGISIAMPGQAPQRLEEITATVIEHRPQPQLDALEEASYG